MRLIIGILALAMGMYAQNIEEQLKAADRKFSADTGARGLDGWMAHFAEDARVHSPSGLVTGTEALRKHFAGMFAQKDFSLSWEPIFAEGSKDGTMGYTLGLAKFHWTDKEGKPAERTGRYLTVWRKEPDGTWKVVSDQGN